MEHALLYHPKIAYFSMEIALESGMPTYSGGLGVLAGDTIRAAADMSIPMVAITLLHRRGYFAQRLSADGWQTEAQVVWNVRDYLEEQPQRVSVEVEGRQVHVRCWKYEVRGETSFCAPVYFLDSDLKENTEFDRSLTDYLYGGDERYRLCQEIILGIGGVRMLRALGFHDIERFHMNEGHSSLLALELLDEHTRQNGKLVISQTEIDAVKAQCVFTTHTPVAAGHDKFPLELVRHVLRRADILEMKEVFCSDGHLNMTYLALNLSGYVNGVAKRHGEVSRLMFAGYKIDAITNGVHARTWVCPPFQKLYDRYIPDWRRDNYSLRAVLSVPRNELWQAHQQAKKALLNYANRETNAGLEANILTIGFARRFTAYKRADLLFHDVTRLRNIAKTTGKFQLIFAGKAHPRDGVGKEIIKKVAQARDALNDDIKIAYLNNYDAEVGGMITAGVDVWLNTPQPPLEASGTSGMKAALNGVPSLSVLDGWWIEGCFESVTGWAIGQAELEWAEPVNHSDDATALYEKLESAVIPTFYREREHFLNMMAASIAVNGAFFNAQRMIQQYVAGAYFRPLTKLVLPKQT